MSDSIDEIPDYANAANDLAKAQGISDADRAQATRRATSAHRQAVTAAAAARRAATVQSGRRAALVLTLAQAKTARAQRRGADAYAQRRRGSTPRHEPTGDERETIERELEQLLARLEVEAREASPDAYAWPQLEASLSSGGDIYVDYIVVPESRQNEGIGSAMLETLLAWADTHNLAVTLDQSPGPRKKGALRRFYQRHGFIRNGTARYYDASLTGSWVRPAKTERSRDEDHQLEGFYSRVARAVANAKQETATGTQWKGIHPQRRRRPRPVPGARDRRARGRPPLHARRAQRLPRRARDRDRDGDAHREPGHHRPGRAAGRRAGPGGARAPCRAAHRGSRARPPGRRAHRGRGHQRRGRAGVGGRVAVGRRRAAAHRDCRHRGGRRAARGRVRDEMDRLDEAEDPPRRGATAGLLHV